MPQGLTPEGWIAHLKMRLEHAEDEDERKKLRSQIAESEAHLANVKK